MLTQQNKEIAREFCYQTWGKGNLAVVDELASSDFKVYYPILPETLDREGFKVWVADTHTGLPDLEFTITDAIAEGEKVAITWTARGTHKGEIKLLNLPPTFKSVSWGGISIYRIVEGKVIEEQGQEDVLGVFQQLGLIPT
ncbi:ester cyclase [Scytonema sp. NUACC26]|uniref:ester cyclase n=1 Tax=Scytonema sp. NUACC26 TaxID=3140176 RepID=UPI0034DCADB7